MTWKCSFLFSIRHHISFQIVTGLASESGQSKDLTSLNDDQSQALLVDAADNQSDDDTLEVHREDSFSKVHHGMETMEIHREDSFIEVCDGSGFRVTPVEVPQMAAGLRSPTTVPILDPSDDI